MKKSHKQSMLLCISIIVFGCLLTCMLIFIQPIRVIGNSMMPSYKHNDLVLINISTKDYSTSDVIILQYGKGKIIKRIYAEPGDVVEIKTDGVYINQTFITDNDTGYKENKYYLGENEYFVLGDNYKQSTDSRYFGVISKNEIIGKVIN